MRKMIVFAVGFLVVGVSMAQEKTNPNLKDQSTSSVGKSTITLQEHFEVVGGEGENQRTDELKFISPKGEIVKQIKRTSSVTKQGAKWRLQSEQIRDINHSKGLALINKTVQILPYDPEKNDYGRDSAFEGEYWDKEVEVFDVKGASRLKKTFRTYPGVDLMTRSYWRSAFAGDGIEIFVYYRDEKGGGNVDVYDISGKILAHGWAERDIEGLEISPDGSLAAGYVVMYGQENEPKYIFLLDVRTGKSKLAKAKGVIGGREWEADFALSTRIPTPQGYKNLPPSTIAILLSAGDKQSENDLVFERVPTDLVLLLSQDKAK